MTLHLRTLSGLALATILTALSGVSMMSALRFGIARADLGVNPERTIDSLKQYRDAEGVALTVALVAAAGAAVVAGRALAVVSRAHWSLKFSVGIAVILVIAHALARVVIVLGAPDILIEAEQTLSRHVLSFIHRSWAVR